MLPPIDEIVSNFELLDDWDERYRYLIELGRLMEKLPEDAYTEQTRCAAVPVRSGSLRGSTRPTVRRACIWWATATPISCAASWPC